MKQKKINMIPKTLLEKDLTSLVSPIIGGDIFMYKNIEFKGHLKFNSEVIFEDSTIGYQTTLLITLRSFNDLGLKVKEVIINKTTHESFKITQAINESFILKRLFLEGIK